MRTNTQTQAHASVYTVHIMQRPKANAKALASIGAHRLICFVIENSNFVIHVIALRVASAKNVESRLRSFVMFLFYSLDSLCSALLCSARKLVVYDINSRYVLWHVSFFLWAVVLSLLLLAAAASFFLFRAHFRYGTSELHRSIHLDLICYVCCAHTRRHRRAKSILLPVCVAP